MSRRTTPKPAPKPHRPRKPGLPPSYAFRVRRGGPGRGGPFGGMNIPAEKAMNFWPSARRLLGTLRPERLWLVLVLALGVASVTLSRDRAAAAGRGHQPDFRRRGVQAAARRGDQGSS